MLVHSVYFWLKEDVNAEQRREFLTALRGLSVIDSAQTVYVGTPAATPERPTSDASYDFALTVLFTDVDAHDLYQIDPAHTDFIAQHKAWWTRVQVYDAEG